MLHAPRGAIMHQALYYSTAFSHDPGGDDDDAGALSCMVMGVPVMPCEAVGEICTLVCMPSLSHRGAR